MLNIREHSAANEFITTIRKEVFENWASICQTLELIEPGFRELRSNNAAAFEFTLAVMAIEMKAVDNLLMVEKANRIENFIYEGLRNPPETLILPFVTDAGNNKITLDEDGFLSPDTRKPTDNLGDYAEQQIKAYRAQLEELIEDGESITGGPAYLLCMRLGLITSETMYKPMLTQILETLLVELGGGWWKNCVEKYDIVP